MAKKYSHNDHFLSSPYPVVTSYENAFIKKFNDNLSSAVAEVLKYIACATAQTSKEEKQETPNFYADICGDVVTLHDRSYAELLEL